VIASLSKPEARKLVLLAQGLPPMKSSGRAQSATLAAIERLGYVQIDTISVIQRAHHHTLWNRNPRYRPSQLDQLTEGRKVFEYWAHAAAYLPMRDFRFTLPRKEAIARGEQEHWFERDPKLEKFVLERIRKEGPLLARDFERVGRRKGEWGAKPAKRALENLFMRGELMTARRVNFQKVYDLTERVLPEGVDVSTPSAEDQTRFLITRFLRAHGLGLPQEIGYLLKGVKAVVAKTMKDMLANGELMQAQVGDAVCYSLPGTLDLLSQPLARGKLKILSPFDNLLIQRQRTRDLFDFDYQIECYLPAAKRRYGYFTLPILWDGGLAARMDCKADRKAGRLHIHLLALEPSVKKREAFLEAWGRELQPFMEFNGCNRVVLHRTSPATVRLAAESIVKALGRSKST